MGNQNEKSDKKVGIFSILGRILSRIRIRFYTKRIRGAGSLLDSYLYSPCVQGILKILLWPWGLGQFSLRAKSPPKLFFYSVIMLPFIYLLNSSIHSSIHPSIYQSFHLYVNSFIHPSFHLYIHSFIHPSIHPYIHSFIHQSINQYKN